MGRRRKQKSSIDIYASKTQDDSFGMIYAGMLQDKAFQALPVGARLFYMICRVQARTESGRRCLFKHGNETGETYDYQRYFVFPAEHIKKYGVDRGNGNRYLKMLENAGFIERVEENKHRFKINVYAFSDKWKSTL